MSGGTVQEKKLFGEICVERGFVTSQDVGKALAVQAGLRKDGKPHKLIGIIMHEMGMLDNSQLIAVIKEMDNRSKLARH